MSNESQQDSLLTRECFQDFINLEKEALCNGVPCVPILLILLYSGKKLIAPLRDLPSGSNRKQMILHMLGQKLRAEKGSIKEAVLIVETWIVKTTYPDWDKLAPSEHPAREEAIVIVGRNEDKSCSIIAMQPFSRDKKERPIWQEPIISISGEGGYSYEGVLDDLFIGAAQVIVPEMKA